jgi:hypothetical protein
MICVRGRSSRIRYTLFPPFDLSSSNEWEMGFHDLLTYNSIPNIEENVNNKICFSNGASITLPTGSYEIDSISEFIKKQIERNKLGIDFKLVANNNTLKSEIFCDKGVDFTQENTIGPLLGFNKIVVEPNKWVESQNQVSINKVDVIRITCNVVRGSYIDGVEGHVLHEFYPTVAPGFKIVEKPNTITYLPINKQNCLEEFVIALEDQNGNLVNFREENINIRLVIREKLRR